MWKSLKEYITSLGHWGWVVLVDIFGSGIGGYLDISQRASIPMGLWLSFLISGVLIAPFLAFHKIRLQRDTAIKLNQSGVATRVITVSNYECEFEDLGNIWRLRLLPEIHAIPGVRVEDIQLEIKGKRYNTDWEPMTKAISGDIGNYVYVDLPKSLKFGKYQAKIVAHINNTEYYSDDFTINHQQPNSGKEVSQSE